MASGMHPSLAWPSVVDGKTAMRPFSLRGEGTAVILGMAGEETGWPWLEIDYAKPRGKLILCGLSLGDHAGKAALQEAAAKLAERLLPKLVKKELPRGVALVVFETKRGRQSDAALVSARRIPTRRIRRQRTHDDLAFARMGHDHTIAFWKTKSDAPHQ